MRKIIRQLKKIEKTSFKDLEKAYLFFRHKYPKTIVLVAAIIAAYLIFKNPSAAAEISKLNSLSYLGAFIAGAFSSLGFLAPFSVGFFIALSPENILLASLIGGIGGLLTDLLIFKFIKFSFLDEFSRMKRERPIRKLDKLIVNHLGFKLVNYLMYVLAGIFIASPLPDEIGVAMIAGLTKINPKIFAIISFTLKTLGIFTILYLSA